MLVLVGLWPHIMTHQIFENGLGGQCWGAKVQILHTLQFQLTKALARSNGPTTGSTTVTVSGRFFGHADYSPRARFGGSACETSVWVSGSSVLCRLPSGSGLSKRAVVSTELQLNTLTQSFQYDRLHASSIHPTNRPTSGSNSITVYGKGFGQHSTYIRRARIGGTACLTTSWVSESSMLCNTPPGSHTGKDVVSSVALGVATFSSSFTYDGPVVTGVAPVVATAGSSSVTVYGNNFGEFTSPTSDRTVKLGNTNCGTVSFLSHTAVKCPSAAGEGSSLTVVITVKGRISTLTSAFAYTPPTVTAINPGNYPTSGGSITVRGSNFGTTAASIEVTVDSTSCTPVTYFSHTSVRCKVQEGVAANRPVKITVQGQQSSSLANAFDYDAPVVSSVIPALATSNSGSRNPSGGGTLTIDGKNFGQVSGHSPTATVGSTACASVAYVSDSRLRCVLAAGTGGPMTSSVTVGSQSGSLGSSFRYGA